MRTCIAVLITGFVLLPTRTSASHVPSQITIQGKLTDIAGAPLPVGPKTLTFRIFDAPTVGTEIWPGGAGEIQTVTTGSDGLWIALIGALLPLTDAVFADTSRWLEITVNDGVNPPINLPRTRLASGPFAFRVATIDGATGGEVNGSASIGIDNAYSGNGVFVVGTNNEATGDGCTIAGGLDNTATGALNFVGSGMQNTTESQRSAIVGGFANHTRNFDAFVGAGIQNAANGAQAAVAGGRQNIADGFNSFVGAGDSNSTFGQSAGIVAGTDNQADGAGSFIGGGYSNSASGSRSVIAGGGENQADEQYSTVGGGYGNLVSGSTAVVSGGSSNQAAGAASCIPGGTRNIASATAAMAAGSRAIAGHAYSFVWGDGESENDETNSTATHQFTISASNGVRFDKSAGNTKAIGLGEHYRDNGIVAWARVTAAGTTGLSEFGVTSSVKNSTGNYTVTVDITAGASTYIVATATAEVNAAPTTAATMRIVSVHQASTNSFDVYVNDGNGALIDNDFVFIATAR